MDRKNLIDMFWRVEAIAESGLSLWEIYQSWKEGQERYAEILLFEYGTIPSELVVDKATHRLIFSYLYAKGSWASGNWYRVGLLVNYDVALDSDSMVVHDAVEEKILAYLFGGRIVGINYENLKDIPKKGEADAIKKNND